jgi:hypothetical protein
LAEQESFVPPPEPVQVHVNVVDPVVTEEAVPAEQRFVEGAVVNDPPSEDPQEPLTAAVSL